MKVSLILNHFLPFHTAGTEVYVLRLSKQLQDHRVATNIIIPNYKKHISTEYSYNGLFVYQYSEPSIVDRSLIMGFRKPAGLRSFTDHLIKTKPDIVHFHEIAGSNGVTIHHVKEAKKHGAKVLFTFHLGGLSCMTGTFYQNGESMCDGKINLRKCTECYLKSKGLNKVSVKLISIISRCLFHLGINPTNLRNSLSTAIGTTHLVEKKQAELFSLITYCDKVIVLTNWYKEVLISNGIAEDKVILIPQASPVEDHPVKHFQKNNNIIKFLFMGRISPFKGLHLLIEAFIQLDQSRIELHIFGQSDGSDYEFNLKEKTNSFGSIYWHGVLDHRNVLSVMSEFDALCLCSTITEMSPLVIQEAFATRLPVIASNVHGNVEQIEHEVNGLLFKFNDSEDLLKQLRRCLDEKGLLPSLAQNIKPPRSFVEVGNDHMMLFKTLLN
jgi:glycosyltransferase involved in cell wall biosynthesis